MVLLYFTTKAELFLPFSWSKNFFRDLFKSADRIMKASETGFRRGRVRMDELTPPGAIRH